MAPAPNPKPSLLSSLGVLPAPQPADERAASIEDTQTPVEDAAVPNNVQAGGEKRQDGSDVAVTPAPRQPTKSKSPAQTRERNADQAGRPTGQPASDEDSVVAAALHVIREQHRARRGSGAKPPLAPLNVDVPLELLQHIRRLSADIPYPLRRLAEEALELWLVATENARVTTEEEA